MTWPPADTDRNRLVYVVVVVLAGVATVYFLLWALQTRGVVPWAGFTLLLATTLVAGLGLMAMAEQRRRPVSSGETPDGADGSADTTGGAVGDTTADAAPGQA